MKLVDIVEAHGNQENQTLRQTPPSGDSGQFITTSQAARILGVTASRVRQFIMDGKLSVAASPSKGRRDTLLKLAAVRAFRKKMTHKPGRVPKKNDNANSTQK